MELPTVPLVSVIISVYNGEKTIAKCLDSVLKLDYPSFEMIVIDDFSNDATEKILRTYKKITYGRALYNHGQALCRNEGVAKAKGEYIAFLDADTTVDSQWLTQLLKCHIHAPAAVGGAQHCPKDATPMQKLLFAFMSRVGFITEYQGTKIRQVNHLPSCFVLYWKNTFTGMGGFRNLRYGEDPDLNYRLRKAGYKLMYNPGAIVYHYPPETLRAFLRKMYKYGEAQGMLVKEYGIFRRIQVVPFITLIVIAVLSILFWHAGFYRGLFK